MPVSDIAAAANTLLKEPMPALLRAVLLEHLLLDNTRPGFGLTADPVAYLAKEIDANLYTVIQGHCLPSAKLVAHLLARSSMAAMMLQDHTFEDDHVPLGYYHPASDLLQHPPTPTQQEWQIIMVHSPSTHQLNLTRMPMPPLVPNYPPIC